jgi:Ca2+:H+ antiporter
MRYLNWAGYLAIPLAFIAHWWLGRSNSWEPTITFFLAGFGIVPLAYWMGISTDHLSARAGPTWGGLLNATFGNAAELIIGIIALSKGLNGVVKASLTGSIIGNLLLVGGGAMVVGGWKRTEQSFSREAAESNAGLLLLAVAGMLFPAIFSITAVSLHDRNLIYDEHAVSLWTSGVLIIVYALGLLFTLKTHAHVLSPKPEPEPSESAARHEDHKHWSITKSVLVLLAAAIGVGFVSELLVGSIEQMAHHLAWSELFIGVILLAIIGNAAEHSTALLMAHRDDMDTAMSITHQSSLQIALFVTPVLVFVSALLPHMGADQAQFMDLMFSAMEVIAVMLAVGIVIVLGMDGKTNWFEGALLTAVYAVLAIAFFYLPANAGEKVSGQKPPVTMPAAILK